MKREEPSKDFAQALKESLRAIVSSSLAIHSSQGAESEFLSSPSGETSKSTDPRKFASSSDEPKIAMPTARIELGALLNGENPESQEERGDERISRIPEVKGVGSEIGLDNGLAPSLSGGGSPVATGPASGSTPGLYSASFESASGGQVLPLGQIGSRVFYPGLSELMAFSSRQAIEKREEMNFGEDGSPLNLGRDMLSDGLGASDLSGSNSVDNFAALFPPLTPPPGGEIETSQYGVRLGDATAAHAVFGPFLAAAEGSGYPRGSRVDFEPTLNSPDRPTRDTESWSGRSDVQQIDLASQSSLDLSKTNDLLQQILEEVRKGDQSFLPLNPRNSQGQIY